MHYLLLDTNVYLDLVTYRHDSVPPETLEYLLFVLKNPNVRLILPEVVASEFYRTVRQQIVASKELLAAIRQQLDRATFPHAEALDEFRADKKEILRKLSKWESLIGEETYQAAVDRFRQLAADPHVISVPMSSLILEGVLRRRILRRAPYHHDDKICDADAAIVEVLVELSNIVPPGSIDVVTFLSRNVRDFTNGKDRESLHPDILDDLKAVGLADKVTYSPYAYKTLRDAFKVKVAPEVVEEEAQQVEDAVQASRGRGDSFSRWLGDIPGRSYEREWLGHALQSLADVRRMMASYEQVYRDAEFAQRVLEPVEPLIRSAEHLSRSMGPSEVAGSYGRFLQGLERSRILRQAIGDLRRTQAVLEQMEPMMRMLEAQNRMHKWPPLASGHGSAPDSELPDDTPKADEENGGS